MSLKLYFTGAKSANATQSDPNLSVGQYISSSQVPNASIDNLFGSIRSDSGREIRLVAIKNETGAIVTNPNVYYDMINVNPISSYRMAVVTPKVDSCGDFYFDRLPNPEALPIGVTFVDNRTVSNAITAPSIAINSFIGIWIIRDVNNKKLQDANSCANLMTQSELVETSEVQSITTVADVSGSLDGKYFYLTTPQTKAFVWLATTGTTPAPTIQGREGIRVGLNPNDSADVVATKIQNQIATILDFRGETTTTVATNVITVTMNTPMNVPNPTAETSGFTTSVVTEGVSKSLELYDDCQMSVSY